MLPAWDTDPADDAAALGLDWLGASAQAGLPRTLAVIWGTVELERALADLGVSDPALAAGRMIDDPLLGARVVVIPTAGEIRIALAEPSTEGRLAATLARHDEGPTGRYVRSPIPLDQVRLLAGAAGIRLSPPADGPFGRAVIVGAPLGGLPVILVDPDGDLREPTSGDAPAVPSPP